ncbi:hypothetical protein [Streptomyces sp. NPDC002845]
MRLLKALEGADTEPKCQPELGQDNSAVATEVHENRILSQVEVAELVDAYRRGASMLELSRRYGVHRSTVDGHLKRAGIVKRAQTKIDTRPRSQSDGTLRAGLEHAANRARTPRQRQHGMQSAQAGGRKDATACGVMKLPGRLNPVHGHGSE